MRTETIVLNEERNVTLTAYLQPVAGEFGNIAKRPAMLVLPGGGYSMCSDREAEPVALAYLEAGCQAFILRYSVMEHADWPNPLDDYEQAMTLIRSRAEEWSLYPDKVAVVGFSAGGHLAAAAATVAKNKPDAAILGYPVTEGETAKMCLASAPDLVSRVDEYTAPCFVFATRNDNLVPISNTINFLAALDRAGVMFESHIYAYGPHGVSVCNSSVLTPGTVVCSRAPQWVADSVGWLKDMLGDFGRGALTEPKCPRRINGDYDEYLSVDCTMGVIMANPEAMKAMLPVMETAKEKMAEKYGDRMNMENAGAEGADAPEASGGQNIAALGVKMMTLRTALGYGDMPEEAINRLDETLRKIKNTGR